MLVYLILMAQFASFIDIHYFASDSSGTTGVLAFLLLTDTTLNVMSRGY